MAIGRSIPRLEDPALLRGEGRFAADIDRPGQLHMRIVRSPVASAVLREVDCGAAASVPGCVLALSASDIPDLRIRPRGAEPVEAASFLQPVLARGIVRYAGEPVAVVFSENPAAAEDAANVVRMDLEPHHPVMSALGDPASWPGSGNNEATRIVKSYGDVDAAFSAASAIVEVDVSVGRQTGAPMETRGILAEYDPQTGRLRLYGAAKVPHANRKALSDLFGLPTDRIDLLEGHVGGGFGIRGELYPEDVLACLGAIRLERPVKWIEDRREHFHAANHARDQHHSLRAAVRADGFITALDARFVTDQGAYLRTSGTKVTDISAGMLPGPYLMPAYRVSAGVRLTNKTPAGTMRSPGRYETTFARERLIDAVALRLGLDAAAVRRTNFITPNEMPYDRGLDAGGRRVVYDSGDYGRLLDSVLERVDYGGLRDRLARRRQGGEMVGVGVAAFVEKSGINASDQVFLELRSDGKFDLVTGAASVGQGMETALAQICAEELGLDTGAFRVIHGQTDRIAEGHGAYASLVTVLTGSAAKIAARSMIDHLRAAGASLLQAPVEDVTFARGSIVGPAGAAVSTAGIAAAQPEGCPLRASGTYRSEGLSYPYGIHLAVVGVDHATLAPRIERLVIGYDVGRAINPAMVEGQLRGAAAQGVGGALFEELVFDEYGAPRGAGLSGYAIPKSADLPPLEIIIGEDAPSPVNPLGAKGAGEGGITGVGAAVAAAIDEAIGIPGAVRRLPVRPSDIFDALEAARRECSGAHEAMGAAGGPPR